MLIKCLGWNRTFIPGRILSVVIGSMTATRARTCAIVCAPVDRPADDAFWLRQAELLEGRKDPRGEFLRLDRGLSARVPLDDFNSAHQARYRKLLHLLGPHPSGDQEPARVRGHPLDLPLAHHGSGTGGVDAMPVTS